MTISKKGRVVWASPQGQSLMEAMLSGKPVDSTKHEETLAKLRPEPKAK